MDNDNVRASAADAAAADPPTLEVEQGPAGTIDSENESDEQESNAGNTDSDSSDINDWMDAVQSAEGSVAKKAASSGNREDTALPGSSNGPVIGAGENLDLEARRELALERAAARAGAAEQAEDEMRPGLAKKLKGARNRSGVTTVVSVGRYGELHYYSASNNLTAYCRCPKHVNPGNDCRKSRTLNAVKKASSDKAYVRDGQGRPVGLLVHWLMLQDECEDRKAHCNAEVLFHADPKKRAEAREFFKTLPGADQILSRERLQRDGEEEEPDFIF